MLAQPNARRAWQQGGNGKFGAMMAILWRAQLWGLIRPDKQQKIGALL